MPVIKSIDLVGVSDVSWEDAALQALREAAKTVRKIEDLQILEQRAVISDQKVSEFQTSVRISFRIDR